MDFKLWCLSDCKAVSWTDQIKIIANECPYYDCKTEVCFLTHITLAQQENIAIVLQHLIYPNTKTDRIQHFYCICAQIKFGCTIDQIRRKVILVKSSHLPHVQIWHGVLNLPLKQIKSNVVFALDLLYT